MQRGRQHSPREDLRGDGGVRAHHVPQRAGPIREAPAATSGAQDDRSQVSGSFIFL